MLNKPNSWRVCHRWGGHKKRPGRAPKAPRLRIRRIHRRHRHDVEAALTTDLAREINREIDREIHYLDAGYFYAPYIPLIQTPVVLDPESFQPRTGILTRYGSKLFKEGAKFYSREVVSNLNL